MEPRITRAQMAKIWASANDLGLDREMLYLLVPRGSISALSQREASELIEQLLQLGAKRLAPPPKPEFPETALEADNPRVATQEQHNLISFLFGKLGWLEEPNRVRGFLRKFAGVETVLEIRERKRASAIIEALKAIHRRQRAAQRVGAAKSAK